MISPHPNLVHSYSILGPFKGILQEDLGLDALSMKQVFEKYDIRLQISAEFISLLFCYINDVTWALLHLH